MTAYTVEAAAQTREYEGKYGQMVVYELLLNTGDTVELSQKPTTAPPERGQEIEGTFEPSKIPQGKPSLRRPKKDFSGGSTGGGNGTWKPRDPAETKRIVHQHSQDVACKFLQIRAYLKEIDTITDEDVMKFAQRFREDVEKV